MNETLKKLSTGLLTLAVIGGTAGLLTISLSGTQLVSLAGTQPKPEMKSATAQPAIETVVVYGAKPANYASLAANRKGKLESK